MKLTKFFAFALAALAFVGCGDEPTTPAPAPEVSGSLILKASTNATTLGETVTFTVEDTNGQDLTAMSLIYDPNCIELTDKSFTAEEAGTYSFFATYEGETSNTVNVRFMATMPELPEDSDPSNLIFQHRPLIIDHTGVNCGYCPLAMDYLLALEESEWKGKYNEVTCHAGQFASGDPGASAAATTLNSFQAALISGYPSIIINFYKAAADYGLGSMKSALNAVYKKDGADVGISMAVTGDEDVILCAASIKSAVEKEYYVNAWLLENDIYSPNQANAKKEHHYYYNYALRNFSEESTRTYIAGLETGIIAAGETYKYACDIELIGNSWKSNNMGVLIVVSAKDANNRIEVVNTAYCKINETLEFEYL